MFPNSMLGAIATVAVPAALGVAMVLLAIRFVLGPTAHDRLVAAESFTVVLLAMFATMSLLTGTLWYFDVVLVLALMGFLSTVAIARYLEDGDIRHD